MAFVSNILTLIVGKLGFWKIIVSIKNVIKKDWLVTDVINILITN